MDDTVLINDTWVELERLSQANRDTAMFNRWMKINQVQDRTMLTINRAMFADALLHAVQNNEIGEFMEFLKKLDLRAEQRRQRALEIVSLNVDPDEQIADW